MWLHVAVARGQDEVALLGTIQRELRQLDSRLPVLSARTMTTQRDVVDPFRNEAERPRDARQVLGEAGARVDEEGKGAGRAHSSPQGGRPTPCRSHVSGCSGT